MVRLDYHGRGFVNNAELELGNSRRGSRECINHCSLISLARIGEES